MQIGGRLFVNVSSRGLEDPKSCQAPYIRAQIAESLRHHCGENGFGGMGWWWASIGKCSLVWAAMMVVPNGRCLLPVFPSLTPSFPVAHHSQPISSCFSYQALHQVVLS